MAATLAQAIACQSVRDWNMNSLFDQPWLIDPVFRRALQVLKKKSDGDFEKDEIAFLSRLFKYIDTEKVSFKSLFEFLSYSFLFREKSVSQIGQDLWILFMTSEMQAGYFVEFGACDGRVNSNTLLLERDFGWRGIVAEPNPDWHADLGKNRRCSISHECVAAHSGSEISFDCVVDPALSTMTDLTPADSHEREVARRVRVPTISLNDLLDRHDAPTVVDYVSIDTEGSEFLILEAFDFSKRQINFLTVEHNRDDAKRQDILRLMESNGFRRWYPEATRFDDWYVCEAWG
ncbi:MAG: FkbM family methyltransferase [Hyphomicrobiales bacterium]|nr:FkbM family methyltransferase [Hyphomicrobiales bacterium]